MIMIETVAAIIVAGGKGTRMGIGEYKQFVPVKGVPILAWAISSFEMHTDVTEIILVVPGNSIERCANEIVNEYGFKKVKKVIEGGKLRQESVYNGLLHTECDIVLIHDGVRPFASKKIISDVISTAIEFDACTVGTAVTDTLKITDKQMNIIDTPDRSVFYSVQTPQGFRREVLLAAHEQARLEALTVTDDAALTEGLGIPTKIVIGEQRNIKITTKSDLTLAEHYADEYLIQNKNWFRTIDQSK